MINKTTECVVCYETFPALDVLEYFDCTQVHPLCDNCFETIIDMQSETSDWRVSTRCPICRATLENPEMVAEINGLF